MIDNEFAIWRAFENRYWPALYLVDGDGRVGFRHFGEGAYEESERAIQALLGVDEEPVRVDAGGVAEAADWDALGSPETYVGNARGERRSDPRADGLALNQWALAGGWSVGEEAAVLEAAGGSIAYRFQARDVNLVLAPPPAPRSPSPCASTGSRRATPTASTSTSPATAPSPSRGCTSSSAGEGRPASARSRSPSSAPACAPTSSPSADRAQRPGGR